MPFKPVCSCEEVSSVDGLGFADAFLNILSLDTSKKHFGRTRCAAVWMSSSFSFSLRVERRVSVLFLHVLSFCSSCMLRLVLTSRAGGYQHCDTRRKGP